jgi:hypothetical protein
MTRSRQTADWGSRAGLAKIVPSSVAVGSGTGSADSLGTVTFSGCSSLSLNGVFSSTYSNYRIVFYGTSSSGSNQINFRVRVAGSDLTSGTYRHVTHYGNSATDGVSILSRGNNTTSAVISYVGERGNGLEIDVFNPQIADYTHLRTTSSFADGTNVFWLIGEGYVNNTTSYDSLTIYPGVANISGTVSIYGYTK